MAHLHTHTLSRIVSGSLITLLMLCSGYALVTYGVDSYNKVRDLVGIGTNQPHVLGTFRSDGNPGTILFGEKPTDAGYSGAHLYIPLSGSQVLTGSFWMQTIGWTTLQDVVLTLTDTGSNVWSLSGYSWSDQAGWIDFSGTTYQLSNTSFSGYAWNDGIGWIDMAGATLEMTSSGAIGKVKIIGNLGGNRIFNTVYNLDSKISPATNTKIMNEVRKNIALSKRNVASGSINTALASNRVFDNAAIVSLGGKLIFENTGSTTTRVNYEDDVMGRFVNTGSVYEPVYSVIAIGADVYIDNSVIPQNDGKPRAIIAIKNDAGVGGNIYIKGGITQIRSSLIAEGSLYSAEYIGSTTTPTIYNDDAGNLFKIPNRQLYIYGSIISNNTIGGYGVDNAVANTCPYNIVPCDNNTALIYDFNHFRDFQSNMDPDEKVLLRGYTQNTAYDIYSMVIEHDVRILNNPPPGLETIR